jgi:translation elongation factor EF-Ts
MDAGSAIKVAGFVRFARGVGIDRPTNDFAAEVGALSH